MTSREFRMRLHNSVIKCKNCTFCENGRALPFVPDEPKYLIIGEAPHTEEIKQNTFFVGKSGKYLFETLKTACQLDRSDFIILNSVLCMPTQHGKSIGKPTTKEIDSCFVKRTNLLYKIHECFGISHILCLGAYARYIFKKTFNGIMKDNGRVEKFKICGVPFYVTFCVHPSSCLYNPALRSDFQKALLIFHESTKNVDGLKNNALSV